MKYKSFLVASTLVVLSLFIAGARAQHDQHHPQKAAPEQTKPGMMEGSKMGEQMMAHHQKMQTLMDQMMQSMAAMEGAKDMTAMKSLMAQHRALLAQMHEEMMQQDRMMPQMADHMKTCPMMGGKEKPQTK